MRAYSLTHLSDDALVRDLTALVAQDCSTTAAVLAHLAEVDARKLYLPAAYPSMHAYCVGELHMSEDAACRRIRAARAARDFPVLFSALADGRLHLSAVVMLAPYLASSNVDELVAAATHQNKPGIEQILAQRYPQPELPTRLEPVAPAPSATEQVELSAPARIEAAPGRIGAPCPRVAPVAPGRYSFQLTIGQGTHDKLQYAQALLSHRLPSGDLAQVLDRALSALIAQLERQKFAATSRPRRGSRPSARARHIPAHVMRAVWQRDQGQCTFVSETGRRCAARKFLEFDHVDPVARGGEATVDRMRLRCHAHNQYEAERVFGEGFMREKREEARQRAKEARARAVKERTGDILAGLRQLGIRGELAQDAAAFTESLPNATLEDRMRAALRFIGPKPGRGGTHAEAPALT